MGLRPEDANGKPRRKLSGGAVIGIMAMAVNAISIVFFVSLHFNLAAQFDTKQDAANRSHSLQIEQIELTRKAALEQRERVIELTEAAIELIDKIERHTDGTTDAR